DHLDASGDQREGEHHADAIAVRPEPADVLTQVFAPLAAQHALLPGPGLRNCFEKLLPSSGINVFVDTSALLLLDELAVSLARRTWMSHGARTEITSRS